MPWPISTSICRSFGTICSGVKAFFGIFGLPFCLPVSLFDWSRKPRSGQDKTPVIGILERGGKVRTAVVPNRRKRSLQSEVRKHVQAGSALYTDFLLSYDGLDADYAHQVVDHAVEYVDGNVHTNGLENYWSLLKRSISGTYVSVEPFHLFRYLDEQAFRYNNRKDENGNLLTDFDRFKSALSQIVGKRLTWNQVTGKDQEGGASAN